MSLQTWPTSRAPLSQIIFSGTSPPSAPYDGQEWIYPVDPTNGVVWRFRYHVGQALPWEFIGGAALQAEVAGDNVLNSPQTSYSTTATPLTLTVPRAGVYDISFYGQLYVATSACTAYSTPSQGTPADDESGVQHYITGPALMFHYARSIRRTLTANPLTMYHRVNVSQVVDTVRRALSITPVKIA